MTRACTHIRTADGTVLARCPLTGIVASGLTLAEALAELRRLAAVKDNTTLVRLRLRQMSEAAA